MIPKDRDAVECAALEGLLHYSSHPYSIQARQVLITCRACPYSHQHRIPVDFHASVIVRGQNHTVCPPQKVSARIIPYSSHGPPGADFVLQGYFSLPDLPGRRVPDNGALLPPSKVLGSCRIEAGGCKTDCQAAAKHLRSLSSPQHYPIPHFPRLFRRDRLIFSGQKNNKRDSTARTSQIPFYRSTEER